MFHLRANRSTVGNCTEENQMRQRTLYTASRQDCTHPHRCLPYKVPTRTTRRRRASGRTPECRLCPSVYNSYSSLSRSMPKYHLLSTLINRSEVMLSLFKRFIRFLIDTPRISAIPMETLGNISFTFGSILKTQAFVYSKHVRHFLADEVVSPEASSSLLTTSSFGYCSKNHAAFGPYVFPLIAPYNALNASFAEIPSCFDFS